MNLVDLQGDSIIVKDIASLLTIFHSLDRKATSSISVDGKFPILSRNTSNPEKDLLYEELFKEAFESGGVDAGEAGGNGDGGVAGEDGAAVFVDVETDGGALHLAGEGVGEDDGAVGAFEAVEFHRRGHYGCAVFFVFFREFEAGEVLAHFDDGVFEAGLVDVDFFDERADVADAAKGVAFRAVGRQGGFQGLFLGFRQGAFREEPYHEFAVRIVVDGLASDEVVGAAVGAFGDEEGAVADLVLEGRICCYIDEGIGLSFEFAAAGGAAQSGFIRHLYF